jgi:cell division protein FtsZ
VNEASSLVQEAAHEDANIIFGAVIDEKMPAGELRVTVIATGLEDDRARMGDRDHERERERERGRPERERERDRERERGGVAEVRHLRREPAPAAPPPAARTAGQSAEAAPDPKPEEFVSPFEDELDVPTFLRRRREEAASEDDREVPAFLRRSAD